MGDDGVRAAVVLDLPQPIADQVRRSQVRYGYGQDSPLPPHITLAGSNGVGELEVPEDAGPTYSTLDAIARATTPITASFGAVLRFSSTDTFVLTLLDEGPVTRLHRMIARSGLRFRPSPFPFRPHCTLTSGTSRSDDETADLSATRIPGTFVLDSLSVYSMAPPMALLHRVLLNSGDER